MRACVRACVCACGRTCMSVGETMDKNSNGGGKSWMRDGCEFLCVARCGVDFWSLKGCLISHVCSDMRKMYDYYVYSWYNIYLVN